MPGVSIRPSEFVEGGAVPVDKNLLWKECRFNLFDYTRRDGTVVATTCAARITYVDDDGQEYVQQYSAADKERFTPSGDGKTLVALGAAQALAKSSNFAILMDNLVSAGFPENRLPESGDISVLDGLYTFNIAIPEPNRAGLRTAPVDPTQPARPRIISVPSQILRLPWEKAKPGAKPSSRPAQATKPAARAASAKAADTAGEAEADVTQLATDFVSKIVEEEGSITRQQVGVRVFKELAKDPNRDAIATAVFGDDLKVALIAAGYKVDGETISKE